MENFFRPGRCYTCKHHILGDYDPQSDYQEHWCEVEENEWPGWHCGMHLENCVFMGIGVAGGCPAYEPISAEVAAAEHNAAGGSGQPAVLITGEQIAEQVSRLAGQINDAYRGKNPLLLGILKGSFVFLADLARQLTIPVEIDFVRLSSYGSKKASSGKVRMVHGLRADVKGRDVLIIDDIVDTGLAMNHLLDYLRRRKPRSLAVCALLDKPSRRVADVSIDYLGFTIPDRFVVGYGLDCDEKYRHLPDIRIVEE